MSNIQVFDRLRSGRRAAALVASLAFSLLWSQTASAMCECGFEAVLRLQGDQAPSHRDCLIIGNNGTDTVPSRFAWGDGRSGQAHCGFATREEQLANGQSVWRYHELWATPPGLPDEWAYQEAYVLLENKATGACLISTHQGSTSTPSVLRFPGTGPYCGATLEEIKSRHPQALWRIKLIGTNVPPTSLASDSTGKCLVFTSDYASMAVGSVKSDDPNKCGMASDSALRSTNQATFSLHLL